MTTNLLKIISCFFSIIVVFVIFSPKAEASTLSERIEYYGLSNIYQEDDILNVSDFGINGIDDTEALQNALDEASRTGKLLYFPKGVYKVVTNNNWVTEENATQMVNTDVGLRVSSNTHIIMDEEAVIEAIPNEFHSYTVFNIKNAENVTIQGGTIVGDRETHLLTYPRYRQFFESYYGETGWGILITGSNNVVIDDMMIKDMWGDAIDLFATNPTGVTNTNIVIQNSRLSNNRRQGISVENVNGLIVRNNVIDSTNGTDPSAGIDIEAPDFRQHSLREARNITIENNQLIQNNDAGVLIYGLGTRIFSDKDENGDMQHAVLDNIRIANNLFDGNNTNHQNTQEGNWKGAYNGQIMVVGASNVHIENNVLANPRPLGSMDNSNTMARYAPNSNPTAGMYIGYSEQVNVLNNIMPGQDVSVINQWSRPDTFSYPNAVGINVIGNTLNKLVHHEDEVTKPDISQSNNITNKLSADGIPSGKIVINVLDEKGNVIDRKIKTSQHIGDILNLDPTEEIGHDYYLLGSSAVSPFVFTNKDQSITISVAKK